jgi:hydroxypyruvate reductase
LKPNIVTLAKLAPASIMEQLHSHYEVRHFEPGGNPADLKALAGDCEILITNGAIGVRTELMAAMPALKLVAVYGVGLDAIDLDYCRTRGIAVTTTPGVLTESVADLALGLLLSASRRITEGDRFVRTGAWTDGKLGLGWSLRNRKLGILGYGHIGQEIARLAQAFSMKIYYCDPTPRPELPGTYIAHPVELAQTVDALVVACAGGPSTAGLVSRDVLRALGPNGLLVNVARGTVVDETALLQVLQTKELGCAALDVFADEPRIPRALLEHPQLVLTPHIASATDQARLGMGQLVLANIAACVAGHPLPTPVAGI